MDRSFIHGSRDWGKARTSELAKSHPWDETGRVSRTGWHACSVSQSRLTLWPCGLYPPGSSVHGILQARILEWVAVSYSSRSSWPRDWTHISCISCIGRWILYHWATWVGWQDAANNPGGLRHRFPCIWTFGHHVDMTKMSRSKLSPLPVHVLKVKSPPPYFRSDIMKTNEDIMAASRLCSPTSLKISPIPLSRVLAGECWNIINTAGILLNKQKVTLNGSEDLTAVHGKEERNQPLHCLWVRYSVAMV